MPCSTSVSAVERSEWEMPAPAVIRDSWPGATRARWSALSAWVIDPENSQLTVASPVCGCGGTSIPPVVATLSGP